MIKNFIYLAKENLHLNIFLYPITKHNINGYNSTGLAATEAIAFIQRKVSSSTSTAV